MSTLKTSLKLSKTNEKPYLCKVEGCGYVSKYLSKLTIHYRTHTGEKLHKCNVEGCEYMTAKLDHIGLHSRTHTGEKPYKCEVEGCEYKAARKHHIKQHNRTHTNKKQDYDDIALQLLTLKNTNRDKQTKEKAIPQENGINNTDDVDTIPDTDDDATTIPDD